MLEKKRNKTGDVHSNTEARSCNHCYCGKVISVTYSEFVFVAFVYSSRNAPYNHLWTAPLYNIFSHYLINGKIFGQKKLLNTKCVFLIFCTTFAWKVSRKKEWGRCDKKKKDTGFNLKYPFFLSDFNASSIFSTDFSKNPQISNFMKISLVAAQLFHAYGQTDTQTRRS